MLSTQIKLRNHRLIIVVIFSIVILLTLGCNLISANYWVHRLDETDADQLPESPPTTAMTNAETSPDSGFETKCLDSPGTAPCPIDACVVDGSQFSAKNEISSELFGKANPSDYQCCANFQLNNNSGVELMGFEHHVTEFDDNWYFRVYPVDNTQKSSSCLNSFSRKDGSETFSKGVVEIVVLYANPHCDWIEWDEPGLIKYRVPIEAGCYSN